LTARYRRDRPTGHRPRQHSCPEKKDSEMAEKIEEWKQQLADAQAKAEKFARLHVDGVIEHELRKAAEEAGAFNADQIITLLKGKSRLSSII
jgi:hypothetical protein